MSSDLDLAAYTDIIFVTGLWMFMAYLFMELGANAKPLFGKTTQAHQYWGERIFGNMHEQSILFVVSLWVHAIFTSKEDAAALGYTWLGFRFLYPWIWMWNGRFKVDQLICTLPQYAVILYMMGSTMLQYKYKIIVTELTYNSKWYGVALFGIVFLVMFGLANVFTKVVIKPNFFKEKPNEKEKEKGSN